MPMTTPLADRFVERRWISPDGLNLYARDYAPAWSERARCLLAHHDTPRALEAARRAISLRGPPSCRPRW